MANFILVGECHSKFKFVTCLQLRFEQIHVVLPISCANVAKIYQLRIPINFKERYEVQQNRAYRSCQEESRLCREAFHCG